MSEATAEAGQSTDTDTSTAEAQASETAETIIGGGDNPDENSQKDVETEGDEQGGEQAEDEGSTDGDEPEADEIPEKYEFQMPEGMEMDATLADAATPIFKELGLTQEQADKVVGIYAEHAKSQADQQIETFKTQLNDWTGELKADIDFGGDNYESNVAQVQQFFNKTVPEDIREGLVGMMESTGVGVQPQMVKYFHTLSKMFPVGEDAPGPGGSVPQKNGLDAVLDRMYPDQ